MDRSPTGLVSGLREPRVFPAMTRAAANRSGISSTSDERGSVSGRSEPRDGQGQILRVSCDFGWSGTRHAWRINRDGEHPSISLSYRSKKLITDEIEASAGSPTFPKAAIVRISRE